MCDTKTIKELEENDGVESLSVQSRALAQLMRAMNGMQAQMTHMQERLADIPVRSEVREIVKENISIHANSCGEARTAANKSSKPDEKNSLKLAVGKFLGFEAQGKAGMVLSAIFWGIVGAVIMFAIMNPKGVSGLWGK
jgi:hypothetical protein